MISNAHQRRLRTLTDDLARGGQDQPTLTLLTQLVDALDDMRTRLPEPQRAVLDALDENETALLTALDTASDDCTALQALLAECPTNYLLIDATTLHTLAEYAQRLAESVGEASLRAMARATMLQPAE